MNNKNWNEAGPILLAACKKAIKITNSGNGWAPLSMFTGFELPKIVEKIEKNLKDNND